VPEPAVSRCCRRARSTTCCAMGMFLANRKVMKYSEKARSLRSISSLRMTQSLADSISHKMTSFLWKTSSFLGNPVESRNDSTSDPALLPAAATEFRTATNGAALFFVAAEALTGSLLPRSLICSLLPGYCAGASTKRSF